MRVSVLREVASGVDALYLSGRASLPADLLQRLELARTLAADQPSGPPFQFGPLDVTLAPRAFGKYGYRLEHPFALIGLSPSSRLPAIRVQPRAEFLHGAGPRGVVDWCRDVLEAACGPVRLSVTRLDLFADFQGWDLDVDARHEFLCRAKALNTYEEDRTFNGLVFGIRDSGAISARLYDKTIQASKVGAGYWPMIWAQHDYDPTQPVLRVEFEVLRDALRQYGLTTPEETLDAAGSLWASLTNTWLTHRVPGTDQTKSRWTISPQWECVQRASIAENAEGINRMYLGKRRGAIENLMPGLAGYLASFGAYAGAKDLFDLLPTLGDFLDRQEAKTGVSLAERIKQRRREFGLP